MTFWSIVGASFLIVSTLMISVWILSYAVNNAGLVDIAWAYAFSFVAVFSLFLGPMITTPGILLSIMITAWSLRLGTYLLRRVTRHHPEEDGRYKQLRLQFPKRTWLMFFGFFQAQAVLVILLSLPLFLVVTAGPPKIHFFHILGFLLWLIAMVGESLADAQLDAFRSRPENRGRTCRIGLWKFSRHPNYFFEWLVWVSFFVFALPSPLGWLTIYCPLLMLLFLFRVTGIPATELQAVKSRGEDYLDYQRTTSVFFPLPPKSTSKP